MMAIADPVSIYNSQKMRQTANAFVALYYTAKKMVDLWGANNISAGITNTTDVLVDGAPQTGYPQVTGQQLTNVIIRAEEFIADMEASSGAKLSTLLQVAGSVESLI